MGGGGTPHNTIQYTHAKIVASALEYQVSWGNTIGEVVEH